jgi:hypothetical protein
MQLGSLQTSFDLYLVNEYSNVKIDCYYPEI